MTTRTSRYMRRKLAGRCVDCDAGLDDDAESVRCVECRERQVRSQLNYLAGRRPSERARAARVREQRRNTGRCTRCGCKSPTITCTACREYRRQHRLKFDPARAEAIPSTTQARARGVTL